MTGQLEATAEDPATAPDVSAFSNKRLSAQAAKAANARKVSGRRRFVDPTTCDRDYSAAETEFMGAIQAYKLSSGRMFPTWSEVLEVLQGLGYTKSPAACHRPENRTAAVKSGGSRPTAAAAGIRNRAPDLAP
jgi:hypothetical protein